MYTKDINISNYDKYFLKQQDHKESYIYNIKSKFNLGKLQTFVETYMS